MTKEEILESIENMSVKDLSELVESIEERFDVSAQAASPTVVQAGPGAKEKEAEEETALDVVLTNPGQKKIPVIKKIKEITGKGLKECKTLVDDLPGTIKEGVDEEEGNKIVEELEELGAEVELR